MRINVLDKGYVRLRDHMGSDLTVVNAARVSYDKRSEGVPTLVYDTLENYIMNDVADRVEHRPTAKDKRLLRFLAEGEHTSPFRHAVVQLEVYAPLMVMRQWGKYRVGSVWSFEDSDDPIETWNESSRRYVTEEPVFYIPEVWRSAPENSKQGSGEPCDSETCSLFQQWMGWNVQDGVSLYTRAMEEGIAPEQARLFLPAYAMYIRAIWTVSLQGVIHFLQQRLEEDSQWEIREYARAVQEIVQPLFPESLKVFNLYKEESL